ncbi:CHASE2 domain-containing protein [Thermoleptolyngbya sp. PKUAC-SCTB121]|uniref:CHASE2 domain-containing protein n=1 Tax=Thermoleptolyngbya sp. PKUAC-SCTB121 TaxID=2811482 RepID=UPI00196575D6|nr:CHASE2 domain-containing protein [Thermoleptolyngbya sp. PKUAC-SCTB121]
MVYRLTVHKIDQSCLFDLSWGEGQRLTASVVLPEGLLSLYAAWQRAYLGYYKQALRGRAGGAGQVVAPAIDWHSQLVQAEAGLLSEFHTWLKQGDLYDLRQEVVAAAQAQGVAELFLTCTPLDLARLPWETWELGAPVQIVRSPATIRATTAHRPTGRRSKARVLAILGDETGLNFSGERQTLNAQRRLLEVQYLGWQPGEDPIALKQRVCEAIADPLGWDVLFFAGHSNEAALVGGQVAIAPQTTLTLKDLTPYLQTAQQRGLQFALFNSCSGLDIAQGLINLGLSQVAIMREPIHNEVAQAFLVQLLQRLTQGHNVQEALHGACQSLRAEQSLTYPSAYLVPSLFRHPTSVPYRLEPQGWRSRLRRWRPTGREARIVAALALVSLIPTLPPTEFPVSPQAWLLDRRVLAQAVYRDLTGQLGDDDPSAVVLVQIDGESFRQWDISTYHPINRAMVADIVAALADRGAAVVGIDYLLDLAQPEQDEQLNRVLTEAIAQQQTWFVFGTVRQNGRWLPPHPNVIDSDRVLLGDAWLPWRRVQPYRPHSDRPGPFSHQLVVAQRLRQRRRTGTLFGPQPTLQGPPLAEQVRRYPQTHELDLSPRATLHPITELSYDAWQHWLQPILDLSLPPERAFTAIPAWSLRQDAAASPDFKDAIVIVAAGGYEAAGLAPDGADNLVPPPALRYWRDRTLHPATHFTGGEAHAYMTHHHLAHRLVVPIPDLWMILLAAVGGKALSLYLGDRPYPRRLVAAGLVAATAGYGLLSLQLYISAGVLLPWLLPSLAVWCYSLPRLRENTDEPR